MLLSYLKVFNLYFVNIMVGWINYLYKLINNFLETTLGVFVN